MQARTLLPPLEQAPDQMAERPLVTVSVIDVPMVNDADPLGARRDVDAGRGRGDPLTAATGRVDRERGGLSGGAAGVTVRVAD